MTFAVGPPRLNMIHFFTGRSLGTAELHGPSGVIARLNREFKGIEIDGNLTLSF